MLSPTRAHMHISRSWFVYPSHLSVCRSVSLSPPRAAVHTWSHQPALTSARQAPQYSRQSARRLQVCLSFLRTVGYTRLQRSSVCVRVCVCQFPKWVMCVCTTGRRAGKGGWAWGQGLALVEQIVWDKRQYFVPGQQSWGSAEFVKVIKLSEWFVPLFFFLFFFFSLPPFVHGCCVLGHILRPLSGCPQILSLAACLFIFTRLDPHVQAARLNHLLPVPVTLSQMTGTSTVCRGSERTSCWRHSLLLVSQGETMTN